MLSDDPLHAEIQRLRMDLNRLETSLGMGAFRTGPRVRPSISNIAFGVAFGQFLFIAMLLIILFGFPMLFVAITAAATAAANSSRQSSPSQHLPPAIAPPGSDPLRLTEPTPNTQNPQP